MPAVNSLPPALLVLAKVTTSMSRIVPDLTAIPPGYAVVMTPVVVLTIKRLKKVITGEQGGISKAVNWPGGGEFVYCDLMRYNQVFMERIQAAQWVGWFRQNPPPALHLPGPPSAGFAYQPRVSTRGA